ncbi:MAG: hypothetical protein LBD62_04365 [Candidatus Margulisbacteria bacterium]|jgi:hypothetical protein|nr:hypothetical protein [Candidatus Margulisiibacteriota bacterium]
MRQLAEFLLQPGVVLLLAFFTTWILARFFVDNVVFALVGAALALVFAPWQEAAGYTYAFEFGVVGYVFFPYLLTLAAYLIGNAFPWRRLEIVRGKMYKLFFNAALIYGLAAGALLLAARYFNFAETLQPWLIYFSLAAGLISFNEPLCRLIRWPARGPLTTVLPGFGALSSCVTLLLGFCWRFGDWPLLLTSAGAAALFFAVWRAFIYLAKQPADSLLARLLQLTFLLLAYQFWSYHAVVAALILGLLNALTKTKIWSLRYNLELWRLLNALTFLLIFVWLKIDWAALGAAAALLVLRLVVFYLYNFLARRYLFGEDFCRRIAYGLRISDGALILLLWAFNVEQLVLSAAVLAALAENLFYPLVLRRILQQSGELAA